jgi:prepilin-type processing-associated H-X9-DG protein
MQQDSKAFPNPWSPVPHSGLSQVLNLYRCPSDGREYVATSAGGVTVAFTAYLGVNGRNLSSFDGLLYWGSKVSLMDITDGSSNTLCVGERPPSWDLVFGWWYAGSGQIDLNNRSTGSSDVSLGAAEINSQSGVSDQMDACSTGPYTFKPGTILNPCDQFHFWSLHSGGSNFLFGDGAVRFVTYEAAPLLPALSTRAGGEPVSPP